MTLIRVFSGHPVVDAVKLAFYRPHFYGGRPLTHEAMRGQSDWSVGDRELMAAYVSKANECPFCVSAHSATSTMWYADEAKVAATLVDLETAPIEEPLRATLRMLGKLTHENGIEVDDVRAVLASSVSVEQIKDALAVSLAFNITDRLANAFGFSIPSPEATNAGARFLLKRGYR
ncbi:MAG: alkylhydroperoxidase AhpD family core domain-containing protein [Mycobacterium sp.]